MKIESQKSEIELYDVHHSIVVKQIDKFLAWGMPRQAASAHQACVGWYSVWHVGEVGKRFGFFTSKLDSKE